MSCAQKASDVLSYAGGTLCRQLASALNLIVQLTRMETSRSRLQEFYILVRRREGGGEGARA